MLMKLKQWVQRRRHGRHSLDAAFSQWARSYDNEENPLIAAEQPVMAELLGDLSGAMILDAGCGTGRLTRLATEQGASGIVGLDQCEEMLCRGDGMRVRGRMTQLPFSDASFDCLIGGLVIGYVPRLGDFLREAARVIRPGGRLICSDLHPIGRWLGWRRTFRRPNGQLESVDYHTHSFSDIHSALAATGFELTAVREPTVDGAPASHKTPPAALIWVAKLRA